jgi:hypothetical protein
MVMSVRCLHLDGQLSIIRMESAIVSYQVYWDTVGEMANIYLLTTTYFIPRALILQKILYHVICDLQVNVYR